MSLPAKLTKGARVPRQTAAPRRYGDGSFPAACGIATLEVILPGAFLGRVVRGRLVVSSVQLVLAGSVAFGRRLLLNVAGL